MKKQLRKASARLVPELKATIREIRGGFTAQYSQELGNTMS